MSTANFIPEIWSKEIHLANQAVLVTQLGVVNHDYEGDVSASGDTVHINGLEPVVIGDYDDATGYGDPQRLDSNRRTLTIDQQKSFDFLVSSIEKAQTNTDILGSATKSAGEGLADRQDTFVLGLMVAGAQSKKNVTITEGDDKAFYNQVVIPARTLLNKAKAPKEGRFLIVDPDLEALALLDPRFIANGSESSDARMLNGEVGRIGGFRVLVSNSTAVVGKAVAGVANATTVADQIVDTRDVVDPKFHGSRVQGLHVYGAKVTRPENLAALSVTVNPAA